MARVIFQNVTKLYGGNPVPAVNDLSMEVEDQEFLVLVGPSGCGKSTAMRMVAGLEEISGGQIVIGDRVVNDLPPKDRDVAMVFQSYALYPHMTVYDNLAYPLKLRKVPKAERDQRVREAARILDIEQFLDRKPKALSGGQRQRVALGRAIVRNADVFLMDEPLSNLDAKLRVQTRAELIKLHERVNTTTIYVTHDQVEAMTMGDRIAVMSLGILQQLDTPQNLYDTPANKFVAGFIGSPSMNFVDVTLESRDGKIYANAPGFSHAAPPRVSDCAGSLDWQDRHHGRAPGAPGRGQPPARVHPGDGHPGHGRHRRAARQRDLRLPAGRQHLADSPHGAGHGDPPRATASRFLPCRRTCTSSTLRPRPQFAKSRHDGIIENGPGNRPGSFSASSSNGHRVGALFTVGRRTCRRRRD